MVANLPDIYRVAVNMDLGGLPCTNVFYVFRLGTTASTAGAAVAGNYVNEFGAIQSSDLTYTTYEAREMIPTALTATGSIGGAGAGAGTSVPPGVALCVTWLTAVGGRSYRGRSYIPGVATGYINATSSQWDDGSGDLQNAVNSFRSALIADGYTMQLYSPKLETAEQITSGVRKLQFASQRRRNVP